MQKHFADRQQRLFQEIRKQSISHFLITSPFNVTYLTGFTGEDSFLFVSDDKLTIWSDARYDVQLQEECPDIQVRLRSPTETLVDAITVWLETEGIRNLHVETAMTSIHQWLQLETKLGSGSLQPVGGLIETLREVKDAVELEAIKRAIDMAQRAFIAVKSLMQPHWTEKNVADAIEANIRSLGGACSAFKTIVGVGPRAALPHGRPTSKPIGEGESVLIDWGAKEDLYLSDLTRVVLLDRPSAELEKVYRTVLQAQKAAIEAIRPGVKMGHVDAVARSIITDAGYGDFFTHSLGHGFGLQIHETVRLARGQDRLLEPGMVVTVEPGVYLAGILGVRIEDDVLVTEDGYLQLSDLPKEWDEIRY